MPKERNPKVVISEFRDEFRGELFAPNGSFIGATKSYTRKDNAKRAARRMIELCKQDPEILEEK